MKDQNKNKQVILVFQCKEYRNYKEQKQPLVKQILNKLVVSEKIK